MLADFAPLDIVKASIQKLQLGVFVFLVLCIATCVALIENAWPYEKLLTDSDVVAIVEPVENNSALDAFPKNEYSYGHPTNDFIATDTRFKVRTVLKGDAMKELTVLHCSYSTNVTMALNGASFIQFFIGPLEDAKRTLKDGKWLPEVIASPVFPEWIAFLKRRGDGRFEPVTGLYDSAYSFRELHTVAFYGKP